MSNSELKAQLRLSISAGLSSCFIFLLYEAIAAFAKLDSRDQLGQLAVIALSSLGMLAVIEPLLERMRIADRKDSAKEHKGLLIRASAFAIIAVASLFHGLLHNILKKHLSLEGWAVVWEMATAVLGPGAITFAWMRGVRADPPRAKRYGLAAGFAAGFVLICVSIVQIYVLLPAAPGSQKPWANIIAVISLAELYLWPILTTFAISGYLGGLAVERDWFGKAWEGIALSLCVAGAVGATAEFSGGALLSVFTKTTPAMSPSFWTLFATAEIANAGWALGLLWHPDFRAMFQPAARSPHATEGSELWTAAIAIAAMFVLGIMLSFASLRLTLFLLKTYLRRAAP
ncbi:MAG: hypothetical protein ACYDC3_12745 [Candidatus Binataceae bacterium]